MLTVKDIAKMFNLSEGAVYKMAQRRKIPSIKLGYKIVRFDPIEVEKHINNHKIKIKP